MSDRPFVPPSRVSARTAGTRDEGTKGRDEGTTEPTPRGGEQLQRAAGEAGAGKADSPEKEIVIIKAHEFKLPEVLAHIKAGKIVRIILPEQRPASD